MEPGAATVVATAPAGPTWQAAFAPGKPIPDRIRVALAVEAATGVCAGLAELHRLGGSHRAVCPGSVGLADRARRAGVRGRGVGRLPTQAGARAGKGPPP